MDRVYLRIHHFRWNILTVATRGWFTWLHSNGCKSRIKTSLFQALGQCGEKRERAAEKRATTSLSLPSPLKAFWTFFSIRFPHHLGVWNRLNKNCLPSFTKMRLNWHYLKSKCTKFVVESSLSVGYNFATSSETQGKSVGREERRDTMGLFRSACAGNWIATKNLDFKNLLG